MASSATAFEVNTNNEDLKIHWDTTVLANVGVRVDKINAAIGEDPTSHQSDYKFAKRGDLWQKRLDVRSEMDIVWRGNFGGRVSLAGWYDHAYEGRSYGSNPNIPMWSREGAYDSTTKRFYNGPSGEVLDAFVFGRFDLPGERDISVRLGQHALVWGNSQVSLGESISWGQQPTNMRKAAEIPGISPKEVALSLNQLSFISNLGGGFSLAGYNQFAWKPNRLPEGGTFLGSADFLWSGQTNMFGMPRTDPYLPSKHGSGNYGLQLELAPDWMRGSIGLIYRRFDEKQPWAVMFDDVLPDGTPTGFHQSYARNVQIAGLVLNTVYKGISVGAEVHHRKNGALANSGFAVGRDGPTGDTWHALINGQKILGSTALWTSASVVAELGYTRLDKVRARADMYNGVGYGCEGGAAAGCATRNTWTGSVIFMPTWSAVWPGIDLEGSFIIAGYGLKGNSPNLVGGIERYFDYSVGVTADIRQRYKVGLTYADSHARNPVGTTTDRGRINLSFTTTF